MTVDVSVALCVYNGERYLREQLDSLLAQRDVRFEIVAIDDGSSDGSVAILEDYARRDARLRVFADSSNRGHAARILEAFALCRAPWIAPCDQDDVWAPSKLRQLLDTAARAGTDAAYSDSMLCDATGRPTGRRLGSIMAMREGRKPLELAFQNTVSGHAMLFRESLLRVAIPVPSGVFYDHWLAICAMAGAGLTHEPAPLVQFRRHDGAQSNAGMRGHAPEGRPWFDALQAGLRGLARVWADGRNDARHLGTVIETFRSGGSGVALLRSLWPYRRALPPKSGVPAIDLLRFAHRLYRMRRRERAGR
jgi:glycosyltransferase involved in cell wall biosynthesis